MSDETNNSGVSCLWVWSWGALVLGIMLPVASYFWNSYGQINSVPVVISESASQSNGRSPRAIARGYRTETDVKKAVGKEFLP
ncbi:MAG: hypothetical protein V1690_02485 [Candidatus Moraniibacteriota bacterium]